MFDNLSAITEIQRQNLVDWEQSLRNPELKQINGTLKAFNPDTADVFYCCIGVFCERVLQVPQFTSPEETQTIYFDFEFDEEHYNRGEMTEAAWKEATGLPWDMHQFFVACNDTYGLSFEQIADIVHKVTASTIYSTDFKAYDLEWDETNLKQLVLPNSGMIFVGYKTMSYDLRDCVTSIPDRRDNEW